MSIFRWACAMALVLTAGACAPAYAANDCGYAENTSGVTASGQLQALCDLTKRLGGQGAASSTPLAGSSSTTQVVGPFAPVLGRPINLTLSGTWSGTVVVQRSVNGGLTKQGLTVGGSPWASYTANCNEPVWTETEAGVTFYLVITRQSGTINFRVAQ